jgi:predicted SprT family Zn-dependent metalloprotease
MAEGRRQSGPRLLWTLEQAVALMAAHGLHAWTFRFNSNVRRAGVCHYPAPTRPGRIELSRHFVERNSDAEVVDTLLHEIAHALVGPRHGHDAAWRAKCREIGARPVRCYGGTVDMPTGKWRAVCPSCSTAYDRHRRPRRLSGWFCRTCGPDRGPIRWRLAG